MAMNQMESRSTKRIEANGPDRGWSWVIAFSCCFINCLLYGLARMSGLLLIAAVEAFQIPRGSAAMPFSASTSVRNLSGSFVGQLGQYFGIKKVIIVGCLLAAVGAACCFLANDVLLVTIFWGGFFGLGSGLATTLLPVAINQHFKKHRGTASGISYSGSYIGSLAFPPLIVFLLDKYGFSGTFLIISAIILNVIGAALLYRLPTWVETPEITAKFPAQKRIKDDRELKFKRRSVVRKLSEQFSSSEVREIVLRAQDLDFWKQISPKLVEGKIENHVVVTQFPKEDTVYEQDHGIKFSMNEKYPPFSGHDTCLSNGNSSPKNMIHKSLKVRCKRKLAKLKRMWRAFFRESSYNLEPTSQMMAEKEIKLVSFTHSDPQYNLGDNCQNALYLLDSDVIIESDKKAIQPIHEEDDTVIEVEDTSECICKSLSSGKDCVTLHHHNVPITDENALLNKSEVDLRKTSSISRHSSTDSNSKYIISNDSNSNQLINRRYSQHTPRNSSVSSSVSRCSIEQKNPPDDKTQTETGMQTFIKGAGSCFFGWFRMFRNPMYVVIGGTQSLYTFVIVCTITIIEDFAKDLNAPRHQLHYAQMVLSIADLLGTLSLGWITDRGYMTRRYFMVFCFSGMGVSLIALSQSYNFTMMLGLICIYGIFESGVVITFPLLTAQFIKPEKQAVAIASTNTLAAPVVLMVPLVIGHFRDGLGCYKGLFHLLSSTSLLCGLIWLLAPYVLKKIKSIKIEPETEIDMTRDRLRYMRPSC